MLRLIICCFGRYSNSMIGLGLCAMVDNSLRISVVGVKCWILTAGGFPDATFAGRAADRLVVS